MAEALPWGQISQGLIRLLVFLWIHRGSGKVLHQGDHRWLLYRAHRQRAKEKSSEHCNALAPSRDTAGHPRVEVGSGGIPDKSNSLTNRIC